MGHRETFSAWRIRSLYRSPLTIYSTNKALPEKPWPESIKKLPINIARIGPKVTEYLAGNFSALFAIPMCMAIRQVAAILKDSGAEQRTPPGIELLQRPLSRARFLNLSPPDFFPKSD